MTKPKSNKSLPAAERAYSTRRKLHGPPNYCRYCTAKLPRGPRKFCNADHQAAFKN